MLILNPLYDWAFKYLLDNNDLAKKFLSAMLKIDIIHLETRNIELPYLKEGNPFVSRFDFKAIIQSAKDTQEVLIEIQKYRNPDPINRFRMYLGESYGKAETYRDQQGNEKTEHLPLIAMYILGYCPQEFDRPYIISRSKVYDGLSEEEINLQSPIIKLLTHTSYYITSTPPANYKWGNSKQEAIIRLFQQKYRKEAKNTIYELKEDPKDELAREIAKYLNRGTLQEEVVKQLRAEEEYYESIVDLEFALEREKQQKEEERRQKEEAKKREEEERRQKEEAKKREEEAKRKLAQKMKRYGESIEDIMRETGLTKEEIDRL